MWNVLIYNCAYHIAFMSMKNYVRIISYFLLLFPWVFLPSLSLSTHLWPRFPKSKLINMNEEFLKVKIWDDTGNESKLWEKNINFVTFEQNEKIINDCRRHSRKYRLNYNIHYTKTEQMMKWTQEKKIYKN